MIDRYEEELPAQPAPTGEQTQKLGAPALGGMMRSQEDFVSPDQLAAADMDSEGGHDPVAQQFE